MRVRNLGSKRLLGFMDEYGCSSGSGKLDSIAAEMLRMYGSPLSQVVVSEVENLLYFWSFLGCPWRLGSPWLCALCFLHERNNTAFLALVTGFVSAFLLIVFLPFVLLLRCFVLFCLRHLLLPCCSMLKTYWSGPCWGCDWPWLLLTFWAFLPLPWYCLFWFCSSSLLRRSLSDL